MDRLEEFFRSRGAAVCVSLCPLADPSFIGHLAERGYRISHFEHTLARALDPLSPLAEPAPGVAITADRSALFVETVLRGFGLDPTPELCEMFAAMFETGASAGFLARCGGEVAGGAGLFLHEGAALFAGDGTLPAMRGRRVQSSLIAHRLRIAQEAGCDLAAACTMTGSTSQRNYERAGFRVVYTKAIFSRFWD
jgi:GNAT superfamily N-acetyltransferase